MPDRIRFIDGSAVTETVASLYSRACTEPDPAVEALLAGALKLEPPGSGRDALEIELENFRAAGRSGLPICQDTGTAVVFIEMGHLTAVSGGPLEDFVNRGVAMAAENACLRSSQVFDPLCSRVNTGDNTPAVIHLSQVPGTGFRISVMAKGAGCENVSRSAMLPPLSGEEGLLSIAESCVRSGASRACPPLFLGIGAGGTLEYSGILAKRALLRKAGDPNPVEYLSTLEQRVTDRLNKLGIGPQGFGGRCTVLETRILTAPCHMASLPVTVCVECHAHRTASCEI